MNARVCSDESRTVEAALERRLRREIASFSGVLPQDAAIAWRAYLAASLEWGVISVPGHRRLWDLLPTIPDDPVAAILSGRD